MPYKKLYSTPEYTPIEISTDAEMAAVLLDDNNLGKVYKFTGISGTYINGDLYEVELVPLQTHNTSYIYYYGVHDYAGGLNSYGGTKGTATRNETYYTLTNTGDCGASSNGYLYLQNVNAINAIADNLVGFGIYLYRTSASYPGSVDVVTDHALVNPVQYVQLTSSANARSAGKYPQGGYALLTSTNNNTKTDSTSPFGASASNCYLAVMAYYLATINLYTLFVYKADDISGLSTYGSTIAAILANSSSLLADEAAVNYMILNCTGEFMWCALQNSTFKTALNSSAYKSLVTGNVEWSKALRVLSEQEG